MAFLRYFPPGRGPRKQHGAYCPQQKNIPGAPGQTAAAFVFATEGDLQVAAAEAGAPSPLQPNRRSGPMRQQACSRV